jgi:hypothetical protein
MPAVAILGFVFEILGKTIATRAQNSEMRQEGKVRPR